MKRTAQTIAEKKSAKDSSAGSRNKSGNKRGMHPNSRAQLKPKPWPKGKSGNPSGKPGFDVAAYIARKVFQLNAKEIYEGMAQALMEGGGYNFSVLADRAFGKIKDKTELSGPEGEPIRLLVKVVKPSLKDML
jgi:hypothetical protein